MWYVMQVKTGNEENICTQCRKIISEELLERCFVPYFEEKRKLRGQWHILKKVMFPGYVFVITGEPIELRSELRNIIGFSKLLAICDEIIPLSEKEVSFLSRIGLDEKQVLEMSEGIIEGDKVIVTEGSLIGMEGFIKKIDRHKRKAWLEIEMFGRMQRIEMGLEIVEKKGMK